MLNYIEPSKAELLKPELEKNNEITDSEIAEKLTDYLPFLSDCLKAEVLPEFDIKITGININDTKLNYDIYLIKINHKWYI